MTDFCKNILEQNDPSSSQNQVTIPAATDEDSESETAKTERFEHYKSIRDSLFFWIFNHVALAQVNSIILVKFQRIIND